MKEVKGDDLADGDYCSVHCPWAFHELEAAVDL